MESHFLLAKRMEYSPGLDGDSEPQLGWSTGWLSDHPSERWFILRHAKEGGVIIPLMRITLKGETFPFLPSLLSVVS